MQSYKWYNHIENHAGNLPSQRLLKKRTKTVNWIPMFWAKNNYHSYLAWLPHQQKDNSHILCQVSHHYI